MNVLVNVCTVGLFFLSFTISCEVYLNVVLEHASWRDMSNKTLVTLIRLERTLNEEREVSNQMELNLNCDIADLKVNFLLYLVYS